MTTENIPPSDLDALDQAIARMTPGPLNMDREHASSAFYRLFVGSVDGPGASVAQWMNPHDAAGIVALRNAAPALLAEVRRLREESAVYKAGCLELDTDNAAAGALVMDLESKIERLITERDAARLDAANARAVAEEAIDLAESHCRERLRAGLDSPPDFAARAMGAVDRLVRVASEEFPGNAKIDAYFAAVLALLGVRP